MRRLAIVIVCALAAGGCAAPAVIADLETDKVIVQGNEYTDEDAIAAKAAEGCAVHGRKAVPVSKWCTGAYCSAKRFLFACKQ